MKANKENPITMAVRINACGKGLAVVVSGISEPSGMIGGTSRVSRPTLKIDRFTALDSVRMPNNTRSKLRLSIR